MSDAKFDPRRRLCPDGSCIGVVGDDGRCRVCGRDAGGAKAASQAGLAAVSAPADSIDDDTSNDDDSDEMAAEGADAGTPSFDPARRLCSDGSCIGLIGADGRCNVCGQPAAD
jgi:hypothetical protein